MITPMRPLIRDADGRFVAPEVKALFDRMRARPVPPYPDLGVERARALVADSSALQRPSSAAVTVRDIMLAGPEQPLPTRLYRPEAGDPQHLLVYFHGGGWVTGSIAIADAFCRDLAQATGTVVASVGYRLSPESTHPGPYTDAVTALIELARLRPSLGLRSDRLIAMGDSAGGNLVAAATLRLRGVVTDQILLYPALAPPWSHEFASYRSNADDPILPARSMTWFWRHYAPDAESAAPDESLCPLAATDLSGMPRTFVLTCGLDVLHDEGRAYAVALRGAGTDVTELTLPGMIHGFLWMSALFPQVNDTVSQLTAWLGHTTNN